MNCKLLVLDLDGTLVNSQKTISKHTIDTLRQVQQQGVKIVLASGRPTYGIMPMAEMLEISKYDGYILSFNGGAILNVASGEVIYQSTLPTEVIKPLYDLTKKHSTVIVTYRDQFALTEEPDNKYAKYELDLTRMIPQRVDYFPDAVNFIPNKCLAVGEPENILALHKDVMDNFSDCMNAFRSETFFLELVPKGIDKALSLQRLIDHLGISREEVIAVGDGFNDLSMIEFAGMGVAMANAQDAVKAAADYITLSNDEDGVADLAKRYILK